MVCYFYTLVGEYWAWDTIVNDGGLYLMGLRKFINLIVIAAMCTSVYHHSERNQRSEE